MLYHFNLHDIVASLTYVSFYLLKFLLAFYLHSLADENWEASDGHSPTLGDAKSGWFLATDRITFIVVKEMTMMFLQLYQRDDR